MLGVSHRNMVNKTLIVREKLRLDFLCGAVRVGYDNGSRTVQ